MRGVSCERGPSAPRKRETAPRKTVIFGTVSDYAGNARRTYRKIARQALAIADRVKFVGPHASHAEAYRAEVGDRLCPFRQLTPPPASSRKTPNRARSF
jgi:hypothetical protein